jgi:DNA-binding protein H-NS
MMAVNLKALTPTELQSLIDSAHAQMADAKKTLLQDVRAKIDTLLKNSGLTLDEVYQRRVGKGKKAKAIKGTAKSSSVAPKYRNPEDPTQTWSGRGRQPTWYATALKKRGVTAESLLITGASDVFSKKTAAKKVAKKAVKKSVRRKVAKKVVRKKAAD